MVSGGVSGVRSPSRGSLRELAIGSACVLDSGDASNSATFAE
jgi:hypothetical protein